MELREFKHWLIDNDFESNELYQKAIKCYQVEAYKAAYLYTYLANIQYVTDLVLSYNLKININSKWIAFFEMK